MWAAGSQLNRWTSRPGSVFKTMVLTQSNIVFFILKKHIFYDRFLQFESTVFPQEVLNYTSNQKPSIWPLMIRYLFSQFLSMENLPQMQPDMSDEEPNSSLAPMR